MTSTEKIRALNDALRDLTGEGRICVTTGIATLDPAEQAEIMRRVFTYSDFTPDNDPYAEHDFGSFEYRAGMWIMWKIDLYEEPGVKDLDGEPFVLRVLTIGLLDEY